MRKNKILSIFTSVAFIVLVATFGSAQKKAPDTLTLKIEGAKLAPVVFNHQAHAEKNKIDCAKCHHKEKDPTQPEECVKCHPVKDAKEGVLILKDAYHKLCTECHKEVVAKGNKAPTKCTECHKK